MKILNFLIGISLLGNTMCLYAVESEKTTVFQIREKATGINLIPEKRSDAPDYFCTWSTQGYVVNYSGVENTRKMMNETNLFGSGQYEGWVNFFPEIREDLYFVLDDSWDIPLMVNGSDNEYLGLVELDTTRFPSFSGTARVRLKKLVDQIESSGWKGVGGWICAQESRFDTLSASPEKYWEKKLTDADFAGFDYWKVDWGKNDHVKSWRKMLTDWGHKYAPGLYIEHAMDESYIEFSDVYRTYDVESVMSLPVTMNRIAGLLKYKTKGMAKGIINCEDELYIAVGLGCAIGIMWYPFVKELPDGCQDHVFPPVGRNLKKRLNEIVRAVRWHRIAGPFGVNDDAVIDENLFCDNWVLGERETWVSRPVGDTLVVKAPARISRNMPLAQIKNQSESSPYVLTSRYPNGAVAVVTLDRTLGRECFLNKEVVRISVKNVKHPIGIFGYYQSLIINVDEDMDVNRIRILAQDLAGKESFDITDRLEISEREINIPGDVIEAIGLMNQSKDDKSAPGLVMRVLY